jgi:hypothetical protein
MTKLRSLTFPARGTLSLTLNSEPFKEANHVCV